MFRSIGASSLLLVVALGVAAPGTAQADSKEMIEGHTQRALQWMYGSSRHAARQLKRAAGVLVFGDVVKMGFGLGGEFGEGALIVDGEIVEFYALAGRQYGVAEDVGFKAKAILFRSKKALEAFRSSHSWKVGRHAQVPMVTSLEKPGSVLRSSEPIVGLVFTEDGLVRGMDLDGNKITRIAR
jgi:lipid-binding SYLF domain-containing protein